MNDDFQGTGNIVIFNSEDGNVNVDVIFDEQELLPDACTHKFGNSEFMKKAPLYYNLDVIISVGYRVKSKVGTQFRRIYDGR